MIQYRSAAGEWLEASLGLSFNKMLWGLSLRQDSKKEIALDGAAVDVNFVIFDEGLHHRDMRLRGIGARSANPGGCAGY